MSVFLTPELKPFFGGTYFPPTSRWGRPGFADLLGELARVWREDRRAVDEAAAELLDRLKSVTGTDGTVARESTVAGADALDVGVEQFQMAFDGATAASATRRSFPRPSELLFLLREHARREAGGLAPQAPLLMATDTLRAMAMGGMRDHIGGGFHRYSVDARVARAAFREDALRPGAARARVPRGRAGDRRRLLRDGRGGHAGLRPARPDRSARRLLFRRGRRQHAARAAGQPGAHKSEGAFYIWTDDEIGALLGDDADVARRRFGIEPDGNAPQDPQGEFRGKNLLYIAQSIDDIAARSGLAEADVDGGARARRTRRCSTRAPHGRGRTSTTRS